jgi:ParB/RepB/Spo0J family partition protein
MSKTPTPSLAESMSRAAPPRKTSDLREMFGRSYLPSAVVPLADATYEIPLDRIAPDPNQPRKNFDPEDLRDLSDSIRENGVLQPITVYENPEIPNSYMIVTGERRFRAAKLAGLTSVPCILRSSDFDRSRVDQEQLVENIQRADLAPIEAARALGELMKRHQYSQRDAAKKLGKPQPFIAELQSILKIPDELLDRPDVSRLPKHTLIEISRAPVSQQVELIDHAVSGGPLRDVRDKRSNRRPGSRAVYYHERFLFENEPPLEIRWKKNPDEVTSERLASALGDVLQQVMSRGGKRR